MADQHIGQAVAVDVARGGQREVDVGGVDAVDEKVTAAGGETPKHIPSALLFITLCAFGDSVIGGARCDMLGRERESVRRIAARMLPAFF